MADFLLELFFTIIVEGYVELMGLIIPKEKSCNKTVRTLITVFAVIMILGLIAMAMFGMYFAANGKALLGWCLIVGAILLSIAQITLGIIMKSRKTES